MRTATNSEYFTVGSVYHNRRGRYEVLQIESNKIFFRYDDGKEEWADKKISERIARNIILEDTSKIPHGISAAETPDFYWTLGAIAAKGDFQAEIPPQSLAGFWNDYTRITGIPASPSALGISHITQGGQNKWGCELRIYIPSSFYHLPRFRLPAGISTASGNNQANLRINSNWFWRHLVSEFNFRAGNTQDITNISRTIPQDYTNDFNQGLIV